MTNKIIAVIRFNQGEAFVMKKPIQYKYTKYNNDFIIGIDKPFVCCYYYERPIPPVNKYWSGWQAFGGRKFDLPLTDGTIEHCWGQWWAGGKKKAEKILNTDLINITYENSKNLQKSYVFTGAMGIKNEIQKLRKKYKQPRYYERVVRDRPKVNVISFRM